MIKIPFTNESTVEPKSVIGVSPMAVTTKIKFLLRLAAFLVFAGQNWLAFQRYFAYTTTQSTKEVPNTTGRIPLQLLICARGQYDWNRSKELGYNMITEFIDGVSANRPNDISWDGGRNLSFDTVTKSLFRAKYQNLRIALKAKNGSRITKDQILTDKFVLPYGYCKVASLQSFPGLIHVIKDVSEGPTKYRYDILVVDPSRTIHYRVAESSFSGERLEIDETKLPRYDFYNLNLEEIHYNEMSGQCFPYGPGSKYMSYSDCVEDENRGEILPILSCMVPWMSATDQCQGGKHHLTKA